MQFLKNNKKQCACFLLFLYIFSLLGMLFYSMPAEAFLTDVFDARDSDSQQFSLQHANFDTGRNTTESAYTTSSYVYCSCYKPAVSYYFQRNIARWNTSSLPDNATIVSVNWYTVVNAKYSGTQKIYVVNGFNSGSTIKQSDYDLSNWSYVHQVINVTSTGAQTHNITQNLTYAINLTGDTTYYFIHWRDYEAVKPTGNDGWVQWAIRTSKLTIEYQHEGAVYNLSVYCPIGDLNKDINSLSNFGFINYKFVENFYDIKMTNTIIGVDVGITTDQYNYQPDPDQYFLNINGITYSGADFSTYTFFNGYTSTNHYLLTFENINYALNDKLVIAIGFKKGGVWGAWQSVLLSNADLNEDNFIGFKLHANDYYFTDGKFNGVHVYGYELAIRFWYDCYEQDIDDFVYDFNSDTVFVSPASNGSLEFITGDPINYLVYSQDMTTQPYININKDGANIKTITMLSPLESRSYTPTEAGSYNITLTRGGSWKAGVNFTVYGQTLDNYIYTEPAKSLPYSNVRIYYNFSSGTGYDGRVIVSKSEIFSQTSRYITSYRTNGNESGFRTWQPIAEGLYYCYLGVVYPNNVTYEVTRVIHPCYYEYPNELTGYDAVYLNTYENYQTWEYSHNFVLWDVVIKANNQVITHVGQSATGSYTWYPKKSGEYNSTLELLTNEGYICLDYHSFYVYEGEYDVDLDNDISAILDNTFDENQQFILGIGIILIGLFSPLYIIKRFNIKSLPNMTYLFTGATGLGVAIWMGLLPLWITVLFVFIFTSVIMWNVLGQMGILGGITDMSKADNNENANEKTKRFFSRNSDDAKRRR